MRRALGACTAASWLAVESRVRGRGKRGGVAAPHAGLLTWNPDLAAAARKTHSDMDATHDAA